MKKMVYRRTTCRACQGTVLVRVFSFGPTPLANAFVPQEKLDEPESFYPLDVYFCEDCHFLQLGHVVSPQVLFKNYVYVSSTSPVFVRHFKEYAQHLIRRFSLTKQSLVADIGSNDGILLKPLKEQGVRVLGIEPAENIARLARRAGVETMTDFFSPQVAISIVKKYGRASAIAANNVFAHIDNLDELVEGVKLLLDKDGVFIIEAPYLVDFLTKNYFDLVYHEHLSYLAVAPLQALFQRLGMEIFDVGKVAVHGGSIRVFGQRKGGRFRQTRHLNHFLTLEKKLGLNKIETYRVYADKVLLNKAKLVALLTQLKQRGKSIAAYGAPAKGNTLLNYFGIGTDYIAYVVDDSPYKQGLFTPGRHLPVVAPSVLKKQTPDYLLILAWNFAKPIMEKLEEYHQRGGRFILPAPRPRII